MANTSAIKRGWHYDSANGYLQAYVDGVEELRLCAADHLQIKTATSKTVRINNRDYGDDEGDWNAIQSKPNMDTDGTASVKAIELSPRFADGVGGNCMTGIMSNPDLKGSSGDLTGEIRCYDAKFDGGTGRTVAGPCYSYKAQTANAATITDGCFVLGLQAAGGGGTGWTGFLRASASGAGGVTVSSDGMYKDPETNAEAGYITIYVGTTSYQVPFYATS